ncbi:MAG: VPLPA-CTERM-specific exosortase XrtD [Pseudomonadota bacterium]
MSTTVRDSLSIQKLSRPQLVGIALVLSVVFLGYEGLANLWQRWGGQKELSHSYFIPLISAWMLWERRDALKKSVGSPNVLGLAILAFSVLLVVGYETTQIFLLEHIGLYVSAFGVALLLGGTSLLRVMFFPLAYLIFMIPPPFWIITVTSWQFQLWSSELGVAMIRVFDVPVLLSGNVIELENITLQVVEACSGLRYLFPFVSLAAIAAYFYRGPIWQRLMVVLSAIPITIVMNSFRIAITGLLSDRFGSSHTEGFLHFFEGWVVFLLCIALLLGVLVLIARLSGRRDVLATLGLPHVEAATPSGSWEQSRFMMLGGIGAACIALAGVLIHSSDAELKVPDRERFASLPFEFEGWATQIRPLDVETEEALGADDYIVLDLLSPALEGEPSEAFNLYVAYLEAQRDGRSWHSPRQCLPGGGWEFQIQEIVPNGEANAFGHPFNRIVMKKGDTRYLVYYWYEQRGRYVADEIWMKLLLIWDVATKQRSDGSMIRLMTQIKADESLADAEARLQGFRGTVGQKLEPYIPN